jgi:hypothetical protein
MTPLGPGAVAMDGSPARAAFLAKAIPAAEPA